MSKMEIPGETLEERIVRILIKVPEDNARNVKLLPINLLEDGVDYDPKRLAELAIMNGQQNRLGYIVDLALFLAERHKDYIAEERLNKKVEKLQYISSELEKHMEQESDFLLENFPDWARRLELKSPSYSDRNPKNREKAAQLMAKWNILAGFGIEEMDDYVRFIGKYPRRSVVMERCPI